jgi:hypothetical protein
MGDDLKPALDAEGFADAVDGYVAFDVGILDVTASISPIATYAAFTAGVMALANAALPEGDPRKITWADVGALRFVASDSENLGWRDDPNPELGQTIFRARRLADKLAALLPPR